MVNMPLSLSNCHLCNGAVRVRLIENSGEGSVPRFPWAVVVEHVREWDQRIRLHVTYFNPKVTGSDHHSRPTEVVQGKLGELWRDLHANTTDEALTYTLHTVHTLQMSS